MSSARDRQSHTQCQFPSKREFKVDGFRPAAGSPCSWKNFWASSLSGFKPDKNRESKAAAIVGAAMLSSAACWTVHFPVPFMPVLSSILSISSPGATE